MSESIRYICNQCGAINRLPPSRLKDGSGRCGKCQTPFNQGNLAELSDKGFSRYLANNDVPIVVDFWASWCQPCQQMAPIFAGVSTEFIGQCRFVKVNTEQAPMTSQQFAIRSIPTLVLFHQGNEIDRVAGALGPQPLQQWLRQGLSKISR